MPSPPSNFASDTAWLELIQTAGALLVGDLPPAMAVQAVAEAIVAQVADGCLVEWVEGSGCRLVALADRDPARGQALREWLGGLPGEGPSRPIPGADAAAVRHDVSLGELVAGRSLTDADPDWPCVSVVQAPLLAHGQVVGAISLYRSPDALPHSLPDPGQLQTLAPLLALALDRTALSDRQERASDSVRRLADLVSGLGRADSPEGIADLVAASLHATLQARTVTLFRLTPDRHALTMLGSSGVAPGLVTAWQRVAMTEDWPITQAARQAQAVFVSDFGMAIARAESLGRPLVAGGSGVVVPVLVDGEVIGVVTVVFHDRRRLDELDQRCLDAVTALCAQAISRTVLDEAVGQHRAELSLITDSLPAQIAFVGADRRYRRVNLACETWFGRDRASIVGRHIQDVLGDETYAQVEPFVTRALAGETVHFEAQIRFPGKGLCWVDALYVPQREAAGQVIGYAVFIHDITARRQAEDLAWFLTEGGRLLSASLHVRDALRDVARLTTGVLADWCAVDLLRPDGSSERIAGVHGDPDLQEAAEAIARLLPSAPPEARLLRRMCQAGTTLVIPDLAADPVAGWLRSAADAETLARLRPRSLVVVPMRVMGQIIGAITLMTAERTFDPSLVAISEALAVRAAYAIEHARLYQAEREARAAAEAAVQLRDDFLSVASHELRTPVASLDLQLEVTQRRLAALPESLLPDWVGERLQDAQQSVRRLTTLVDALLDVSRLQEGQMRLESEPVDIGHLVRGVAANYRDDLARVGSPLHLDLPSGLVGLYDRLRLEQVVTNLLANAIKYGAGRPVAVAVSRQADQLVLSVADKGAGIAEADRQRLFQRFVRLESGKGQRGFGLGLWIVQEIVTLLGGRIEVESQPGAGSTFRVTLPWVGLPAV